MYCYSAHPSPHVSYLHLFLGAACFYEVYYRLWSLHREREETPRPCHVVGCGHVSVFFEELCVYWTPLSSHYATSSATRAAIKRMDVSSFYRRLGGWNC